MIMDENIKSEIIEVLQCAEINCDNVSKLGPPAAMIAKLQIIHALKLLGSGSVTE